MRFLRSLIDSIADRRRSTGRFTRPTDSAEDEHLTLRILRRHLRSEPASVRFIPLARVTDLEVS